MVFDSSNDILTFIIIYIVRKIIKKFITPILDCVELDFQEKITQF